MFRLDEGHPIIDSRIPVIKEYIESRFGKKPQFVHEKTPKSTKEIVEAVKADYFAGIVKAMRNLHQYRQAASSDPEVAESERDRKCAMNRLLRIQEALRHHVIEVIDEHEKSLAAFWEYHHNKEMISDDEDDVHPNIDTHSLFRMRHRHRLERQQAREANKQQLQFEIEEIKKTIDKGGLSEVEYEAKMKELKEREEALGEIATEERKEGLDIDKFVTSEKESKIGFGTEDSELERQISGLDYSEKSSSEISVDQMLKSSNESLAIKEEIEAANRAKQQLKKSEEETEAKVDPDIHQLQVYKDYVKRHKKVVRQFYTHKDPVKLKLFLLNHPEVVNDAVMSVALIDMVNYFSEDGHEKMLESYEEERNSLLQKSRMLADSRLEDIKAQELEERKKYLGGREPLDPNCVINEIPKEMAHCFIQRDTEQLIKVLSEYNPEEASKYMDMCVRSGLWTPNPSDDAEKVEEEVLSEYDKSDVPEGEEPVEKAKSEQKNV